MQRRKFIKLIGGAAAAWPLAARAQQGEGVRRVGLLMSYSETDPEETSNVAAFVMALGNAGWVPGRNVAIDYRWAAGDPRRMQEYARELVSLAPDVIFAKGACVPAVVQATSTIPIVFAVLSDTIAQDYVMSFARPGRNITGFTSNENALVGKRVEFLKEISPRIARVLYIRGLRPSTRALFLRLVEDASQLGLAVTECAAENEADIERAVAAFAREPDGGISIGFDAFNTVHREKIVELAARHRLPAIYFFRLFVESGGLLSYGFNQTEQFRQAASYVDRILKGEKPGDLPVQAPTKFELVINLKTAKALGLTIPPGVLAIADEVIE
jgi:putative tryptophan/tyrosine transport system substrate-binding protein